MRSAKKKTAAKSAAPRVRNAHSRQRQRLIDACISALHIYGPSRTTVEKVVAIAKMSPGIVRFYFASKAVMLVASLQFLAAEFEEQCLVPVARLKTRPVTALELLVDLYLDSDIASPRKVSVWYAFWGEASSRQEYYDICGQKDESFAALVRELIEGLIGETKQRHLDPDGIALGLIGVLEILWQDFAFRTEADIDRPLAKRRCLAYLNSVFPGRFGPVTDTDRVASNGAPGNGAPGRASAEERLPAWSYDNALLFALERECVFRSAWQFVGHEIQLPAPGDYLAAELGFERALILREPSGTLRALRNSCTESPHRLVSASSGHLDVIVCTAHGLQFDLGGRGIGSGGERHLSPLELRNLGGLLLIRSQTGALSVSRDDAWESITLPPSRPLAEPTTLLVSADWKLIAEQWLEARPRSLESGWSRQLYAKLVGRQANIDWRRRWLAPNHWIEERPDGFSIFQILPMAPGRSSLRRHHYTVCAEEKPARLAQYLAARMNPMTRRSAFAVAESAQDGIGLFGSESVSYARGADEVLEFRRRLRAALPVLDSLRPPSESLL